MVGVGKPPDDCAGVCRCFARDSAVARLAWHLGASARWGVYSQRRRKDVLRLQFAVLTRRASPLTERQLAQLSVVQREISALNPLSRKPQRESRALRAFRRTLGGPAFRSAFERWYGKQVDPTPLRAFVAEFPDNKTRAAHREVRLPHNGRPRDMLTLSRDEQRALVTAALAEVEGKLEDESESSAGCPFDRLADRSTDVLAALLNLSTAALAELERGRQKPRRTTRHRAVRGSPTNARIRAMDDDVLALGRFAQDPRDPLVALLASDALAEIGHAAIRQALRQPRYGTVADLGRP